MERLLMIKTIAWAEFKNLYRSKLLRIAVLCCLFLVVFTDPNFNVDMIALLMTTCCGTLYFLLVYSYYRDTAMDSLLSATKIDTYAYIIGKYCGYLLMVITLLLICWFVTFPFSGGQSSSIQPPGSRIGFNEDSCFPVPTMTKVFLSNVIMLGIMLFIGQYRTIGYSFAFLAWIYIPMLFMFIFISVVDAMYINQVVHPARWLMLFPPSLASRFHELPSIYWVLPALGSALIAICGTALSRIKQREGEISLLSSRQSLIGVAIGVVIVGIGEVFFGRFIQGLFPSLF